MAALRGSQHPLFLVRLCAAGRRGEQRRGYFSLCVRGGRGLLIGVEENTYADRGKGEGKSQACTKWQQQQQQQQQYLPPRAAKSRCCPATPSVTNCTARISRNVTPVDAPPLFMSEQKHALFRRHRPSFVRPEASERAATRRPLVLTCTSEEGAGAPFSAPFSVAFFADLIIPIIYYCIRKFQNKERGGGGKCVAATVCMYQCISQVAASSLFRRAIARPGCSAPAPPTTSGARNNVAVRTC